MIIEMWVYTNEERAMGTRITCINISDVFLLLKIPLEESRLSE